MGNEMDNATVTADWVTRQEHERVLYAYRQAMANAATEGTKLSIETAMINYLMGLQKGDGMLIRVSKLFIHNAAS